MELDTGQLQGVGGEIRPEKGGSGDFLGLGGGNMYPIIIEGLRAVWCGWGSEGIPL